MSVSAFNPLGLPLPEGDTDPTGIMCSAYRNTDGKWVVVAINYAEDARTFSFTTEDKAKRHWQLYRTSEQSDENLSPVKRIKGKQVKTSLPPRSITTFVSR